MSPSSPLASTGRTSVKPRSRSTPSSGGWQTRGTSLASRSTAVWSRWSACRWVTKTASRWRTSSSAGSGSSTSGLRRSLGVFATGARRPGRASGRPARGGPPAPRARSHGGSTAAASPPDSAPNLHETRARLPYGPGTLGAMRAPLICVVEDEAVIASAVAARLRAEGFEVDVAHDGPSGVALCERMRPDLVVLDVMLPGMDGLEVCRRVQRERAVPVLMLTARGEETDVLVGLGVGADDYMTKPFSPRELVARVRALLRRVERRPAPVRDAMRVGILELDPAARLVTVAGEPVHLTPTEFDLLSLLAAR